ncbi:TetR/AcrR family transcriptional regulator [Flindersiella endophytica]
MPKLTEARRAMRRGQIAVAALRCFARNGLERTSIIDIATESGLSAGSIYSHFRNKADLVAAVTREVLDRKAALLEAYAAQDHPPGPDDLLARLSAAITPEMARVAVQTWGEATTDPALRDLVLAMSAGMRELLHDYLTSWLVRTEGRDPTEARELAGPMAGRVIAQYQAEQLSAALQDDEETGT